MKDIFCAKCQIVTPHKGVVDANGEFVFFCQNAFIPAVTDEAGNITTAEVLCDRFVKFPADTTKEQFDQLLEVHQAVNEGQVSLAAQEDRLNELLGDASPQDAG